MHPRPSCRSRRLLLTLAALAAPLAAAPPADAAVTLAIKPTLPTTLTVGQGAAASIALVNSSTGPDATLPVSVTAVFLTTSCGGPIPGSPYCPAALADPAVFALAGPGVGRAATGCQGITFAISLALPALGVYQLTPTTPFHLAIPGSAAFAYTCIIDFGVTAAALPAHDANASAPGLQTDAIAAVTASTSATSTGSAIGVSESTLAAPAPPPPPAPVPAPAPRPGARAGAGAARPVHGREPGQAVAHAPRPPPRRRPDSVHRRSARPPRLPPGRRQHAPPRPDRGPQRPPLAIRRCHGPRLPQRRLQGHLPRRTRRIDRRQVPVPRRRAREHPLPAADLPRTHSARPLNRSVRGT